MGEKIEGRFSASNCILPLFSASAPLRHIPAAEPPLDRPKEKDKKKKKNNQMKRIVSWGLDVS